MDTYPYKRRFQIENDIRKMFSNLQSYHLRIEDGKTKIFNMNLVPEFMSRHIYAKVEDYDYTECDNITDYFSEKERVKCKRKGDIKSSHEFWMANKKLVQDKSHKDYKSKNPFYLRETLFGLKYECTSFKPSLAVGFIKNFKVTNVLDISSGWGDRLIGAMAAGVGYTGVDPNANLFPFYEEMIEFFKPANKPRMINSPFETVEGLTQEYDMVFTSPPYFDLELYPGDGQSYMKEDGTMKTVDEWYSSFLIPSLEKAWGLLKPNGYMIININDVKGETPYVRNMIVDISKFTDCSYRGCVPQWRREKE